jgi:hypothetical protein
MSRVNAHCNVNSPNPVIFLIVSHVFEWCVVLCNSQNGYQNGKCINVIGVRAQNMITILSSTINIIEGEEKKLRSPRGPTWMKCLFIPPLNLCPRDIGVEVRNYFPLSRVDIIEGDLYDHLMSTRIFTWMMNKLFIWVVNIIGGGGGGGCAPMYENFNREGKNVYVLMVG